MTTDDELQGLFDAAQSTLELDPGSSAEIRQIATRRTRNRRAVMALASVLAVVGVGALLVRAIPDSSAPSVVAGVPEASVATDAITEADFTYVGAFQLPNGDFGDSRFSYGGEAVTFFAAGDPGSDDGFDGSLFMSGHPTRSPGVAEVSIPAPVAHNGTTDGLPIAEVLQPFADITDGLGMTEVAATEVGGTGDPSGYRYSGFEIIDTATGPRLAWTIWQWNNVSANHVPGHGHSSLDLTAPDPQGPWFLGDYDSRATGGYLFEVPTDFADEHLGGNRLISGNQDSGAAGRTSFGPPFFAFNAPDTAEPGATVDVVPLAFYDGQDEQLAGFERPDTASGAEWITTPDGREAVVTVGRRGLGEPHNGKPRENDCGINSGAHAGPYEPEVLFYDPADLARAASGEVALSELAPYRSWNPAEHLVPTCDWWLSSISFDESTGRLYVVQTQAETAQSEFARIPVVHVFTI